MDFVVLMSEKTGLPVNRLVSWLGIAKGKFYDWQRRYGKVNEHNGKIPRDFWLEDWERQAIVDFFGRHPLEGYRRLAFMMLAAGDVAVSPFTVYSCRSAGF